MTLLESIHSYVDQLYPQLQEYRHHFHQHPELSFKEFETAAFLQKVLAENTVPFSGGWVKTGIKVEIEGTAQGQNKTIALRGDIDALPIQETTALPFASKNEGVMHACGHDIHTTCVLGAVLFLNSNRHLFSGKLIAIFQPGEEVLPGGAHLMLEEGVFKDESLSAILGQHVLPELAVGKIGFCPGPYMASCDELHIEIKGKGGHAALPHLLHDPVLAQAEFIVALQSIGSRNAPSNVPHVLSIGKVEAEGATNIIPSVVRMKGTFRTMNEAWRQECHQRILQIAKGIENIHQVRVDVEIRKGYPNLTNDIELTARMKQRAIALFGEENVVDLSQRMTAEDFAYFAQAYPACFWRIGVSANPENAAGLHNSNFVAQDEALKTGVKAMILGAIEELN